VSGGRRAEGDVGRREADRLDAPEPELTLRRALATLRRNAGVQCAILVDSRGEVMAEAGQWNTVLDQDALSVLAQATFIAADLGRGASPGSTDQSLHYYEMRRHQIYAAAVADLPFLLVALGRDKSPAYMAVVWLFVRRTVRELGGLICSSEAAVDDMEDRQEKCYPVGERAGSIEGASLSHERIKALGVLMSEKVG